MKDEGFVTKDEGRGMKESRGRRIWSLGQMQAQGDMAFQG